MKTWLAKCLPLLFISVTFMAGIQPVYADPTTKSYLKTFGADLMTGGWFESSSGCSSGNGTDYQNPSFFNTAFPTPNALTGGILTYTKSSGTATGGSSSQYGVMSLGKVDDVAGSGFYSGGSQPNSNVKRLSFANIKSDGTSNGAFGGTFEGSVAQSNCIPDYFDVLDPSTAKSLPANWRPVLTDATSGDTYYGTAPAGNSLDLFGSSGAGDLTVSAGKRVAIYINGDVYIDKNVVYDSSATVDQVPKFMLVVKGSIYVDPSVTRLDGFYIAQPADNTAASISSDTGIFWSCHPQSPTANVDIYTVAGCTKPLVINGAIVAKQLDLLRVKGDVNSSNTGEDSNPGTTITNCTTSPYGSCNVAEIVNYGPSTFMGGGFTDTSKNDSTSGGLPVDKLISLPPVF